MPRTSIQRFYTVQKMVMEAYSPKCARVPFDGAVRAAVCRAIAQTRLLIDGEAREKMIELVYIKQSHTPFGAALELFQSERTGAYWNVDFLQMVGSEMGLLSDYEKDLLQKKLYKKSKIKMESE